MFKWIVPKKCRDDMVDAVPLPVSGVKEECPPCNPGMEYRNGTCQFCKPGQYSQAGKVCETCPASTAPEYQMQLKWWNNLPLESNITTSCLSMNGKFRKVTTVGNQSVPLKTLHYHDVNIYQTGARNAKKNKKLHLKKKK